MLDLYLADATMLLLAALLFAGGRQLSRRLSGRRTAFAATVVLALAIAFGCFLSNSPALIILLPYSCLPVVGNWLPPAAALLAGLVGHRMSAQRWRRGLLLIMLLGLAAYHLVFPLLARVPPTRDVWADGVCLQTSEGTCSPAAAATLLRAHGIPATEGEMARLCLTSAAGTSHNGLYRGLKLKTEHSAWRVKVLPHAQDNARLPVPALLSVWIARDYADSRYVRGWGWQPGTAHSVVYLGGSLQGKVKIADPAVGREEWFGEDLRILWHGTGLYLERDE